MKVLHEPVAVREEFYFTGIVCFVCRLVQNPLGTPPSPGRRSKIRILKSEDLPVRGTVDHEDLVRAEETDGIICLLFCAQLLSMDRSFFVR